MDNPTVARAATSHRNGGRLLRSEPRLFLLGLVGMLMGLTITGYGVWLGHLGHFGDADFWEGFVLVFLGANLAGVACALRPGPARWQSRVITQLPGLAGLLMSVVCSIGYYSVIGAGIGPIFLAGLSYSTGINSGIGHFQERLATPQRTEWLWTLHTFLSALLFMTSIWIYTALATQG